MVQYERSLAHLYLGYAYFEKYLALLPLDVGQEERTLVMGNAQHHIDQHHYNTTKAQWLECIDRRDEVYNITQIFWFLEGRRDDAKTLLEALFDAAIDDCDADTVYCHCCRQRDGESVKLLICSGCKVTYYCNRKHQKKKWRRRFVGHRMLCPFLKRWRRVERNVKEGVPTRDSFVKSITKAFFDMIERMYSKKIWLRRS